MTENSTSPCAGGKCVPFKGSLSGVCAYTPPKYDKKSDKTTGDVTTCERFKDLPGAFPAQGDVTQSYVKCSGNGEVVLPFGAAEHRGPNFLYSNADTHRKIRLSKIETTGVFDFG